jgi:microcystin-dependent protein
MTTEFILWSQLTGLDNNTTTNTASIGVLEQQTGTNTASIEVLEQETSTNTSNIAALQSSIAPVGTILMFAGSTIPEGWLVCDGSLKLKATYPALSTLLGNTYGTPEDEVDFILPNLCGRMPIGTGQVDDGSLTTYTLGQKGGASKHTNSIQEMPPHSHRLTANNTNSAINQGGISTLAPFNNLPLYATTTEGNGTAWSIMNPFTCINFIIKY